MLINDSYFGVKLALLVFVNFHAGIKEMAE